MSKCSGCKVVKTAENTNRNRARADGFHGYCKTCNRVRLRKLHAPLRFDIDEDVPPEPPKPPESPLQAATTHYAKVTAARDLRQENSALLEENERLKKLVDVAKGIGANVHPAPISAPAPTRGDAVACVVASDWHVEEPVEAGLVHGMNEYNLEIAKRRSQNFFTNALRLVNICARDSHIETIWLGLLGDFFSGHIHEELQENNLLGPADAANFALELLASGINHWLENSTYNIDVDCISGNHGRMTKKQRHGDIASTSLESFMYASLARRYVHESRVKFRIAQGEMLYREYFENFRMRIIHGNQIGYQGGVGGVTIPIRKKIAQWDKGIRAQVTVLGHLHTRQDGGDFMSNGSLIGYNGFAQTLAASPEQPQQSFFLISNRNGGEKTIAAPIWVEGK